MLLTSLRTDGIPAMLVKIVVHEAEEGGWWAEVPALPGCASQADTMDELLVKMREAIAAWIEAESPNLPTSTAGKVVELTV
jgi:predicted RNase H-like HicB family nuclease